MREKKAVMIFSVTGLKRRTRRDKGTYTMRKKRKRKKEKRKLNRDKI